MTHEVSPNVVQSSYRWYNDDGDVCANTAKANADTKITGVQQGDILRLRIQVEETKGASFDLEVQLEFREQGGAWAKVPVTASTEEFEMYDSAQASTCTQTTTAKCASPSQTWKNGHYFDDINPDTTTVNLNAQSTEIEVCIKATTNLQANKTYEFRLTDAGTVFNSYTILAELDSWSQANLTWSDYGTYIQFDKSKFSDISSIKFEVRIRYGGGSYEAHARLYNVTDGAVVSGSEVTSTSTTYEFKESGDIQANLPNALKTYKVEMGAYTGEVVYLKGARIKVELVVV